MCNLYTTRKNPNEVAAFFCARIKLQSDVSDGEVYPGRPSMVIREDAGERILQGMNPECELWRALTRRSASTGSTPARERR